MVIWVPRLCSFSVFSGPLTLLHFSCPLLYYTLLCALTTKLNSYRRERPRNLPLPVDANKLVQAVWDRPSLKTHTWGQAFIRVNQRYRVTKCEKYFRKLKAGEGEKTLQLFATKTAKQHSHENLINWPATGDFHVWSPCVDHWEQICPQKQAQRPRFSARFSGVLVDQMVITWDWRRHNEIVS